MRSAVSALTTTCVTRAASGETFAGVNSRGLGCTTITTPLQVLQ